ncbi:MAG: NAD(+) synthase [Bacteroidales bacterium]|nr:NAD(+) synthase [Bacteroidales bacterium]
MKNNGFIRVAAAVPTVRVADTRYNTEEICRLTSEAFKEEVSLVVFPELSVTGATCGDIFRHSLLLKGAEEGIMAIAEHTRGTSTTVIAGAPVGFDGKVISCSIVIRDGEIMGIVPDMPQAICTLKYAGQECLMGSDMLFAIGDATFAFSSEAGAHIVVHPSAENELIMTDRRRRLVLESESLCKISACIHAGAGFGESTTDYVHAGAASIWETGECLAENERFQVKSSLVIADVDIEKIENLRRADSTGCHGCDAYTKIELGSPCETDFEAELKRHVEPHPFAPAHDLDQRCREILDIQTAGLATRLHHIQCKTAVIGISGGLDSTLALLVAAMAFDKLGWDRKRIIGVTMPGYGTTSRTKNNASELMDSLGITSREISIKDACDQHFKDIGHNPADHDVTYENSQARERTQILMDIANQTWGMVIGTGDLSELALGWATYNGDHMSMYGVNAGVPKTLVRSLVIWAAENRFPAERQVLLDIADTPISPELLPANEKGEIQQVTEDLVGPYELHDFFIYNFVRLGYSPDKIFFLAKKAFSYDDDTIKKWLKTFLRRFFNQQFKRSCLPDGPAVGSVSLSPRGAWNMPSDASSALFQDIIL